MSVAQPQVTQAQAEAIRNYPVGQTFTTINEPVQPEVAPVLQEETSQDQLPVPGKPFPIPEDAAQLSSGVWVVFNRLNRSISTDLTIKTFNNVNLDKKGNLVTDNLNTKDQMNMAKSISEYHSTLIMQGVELVGTVDDYREQMDLPDNWVKKLFRTGLVNEKYFDVTDEDDVEFLFLRYYAFQSEDDWALLSQRTLNT